jgi:valyl-tRNA synthetase
MICSYGDKFDVESVNRHNLEPKIVFEKDGTVNSKGYEGLKIKDARKKILKDLEEAGLITEKKEIMHSVNTHDRCGTEIEFLPTKQWFIKLLDKKEKLIEQGKKIKWYPEYMFKRYENWVNGLEWDWNISRNRHFGIPIPLWKCPKCGEIILPKVSELPIDPIKEERFCDKCKEKAVPEEMVLDTWATSSLSPQIASSLVDNKIKLPYSLRPQGHDIIRTWAFYTITRSFLHENKIPWKEIMVAGNVTLKGEKMSKSKGNVVDPKKVLGEYGADALRFSAALPTIGSDPDYREEDLILGKKTVTKLYNATKFVFMNLEDYNGKKPKKLEKIDEQFLNKLNSIIEKSTKHFEKYEYSKSKATIEAFFWKDFCDNYLEIVKKRVYQGEGDKRISAQYTLYKSLLTIIKLFAPIIPFITEEIYQEYFKKTEKGKSIHLANWPKAESKKEFDLFDKFCDLLYKIRQEKSNEKKSMKSEIKLTLNKKDFVGLLDDLTNVSNSLKINDGKFNVEFVEEKVKNLQ